MSPRLGWGGVGGGGGGGGRGGGSNEIIYSSPSIRKKILRGYFGDTSPCTSLVGLNMTAIRIPQNNLKTRLGSRL